MMCRQIGDVFVFVIMVGKLCFIVSMQSSYYVQLRRRMGMARKRGDQVVASNLDVPTIPPIYVGLQLNNFNNGDALQPIVLYLSVRR